MVITKEQQEALINNYVKEKHNQDECIGFIDGVEKTMQMVCNLSAAPIQSDGGVHDGEFIVCSAIQYFRHKEQPLIVCGLRHNDCISIYYNLTGDQTHDEEQGFLTSKNRFVTRIEAGKIALACGQIKELKYYGGKMLDSSDLYHSIYPTPTNEAKEDGWISVEDRLPDQAACIFVYKFGVMEGKYFMGRFLKTDLETVIPEVTHWMPLPPPPVSKV